MKKMLPDHKTGGSMMFEEEIFQLPSSPPFFKIQNSVKKLRVKALHSADCPDPGYKVLNDAEIF
jgi:hypothetical protein